MTRGHKRGCMARNLRWSLSRHCRRFHRGCHSRTAGRFHTGKVGRFGGRGERWRTASTKRFASLTLLAAASSLLRFGFIQGGLGSGTVRTETLTDRSGCWSFGTRLCGLGLAILLRLGVLFRSSLAGKMTTKFINRMLDWIEIEKNIYRWLWNRDRVGSHLR